MYWFILFLSTLAYASINDHRKLGWISSVSPWRGRYLVFLRMNPVQLNKKSFDLVVASCLSKIGEPREAVVQPTISPVQIFRTLSLNKNFFAVRTVRHTSGDVRSSHVRGRISVYLGLPARVNNMSFFSQLVYSSL